MIRRKIISFDCDGVITGGGFIPPELRTNAFYAKLDPREDAIPSIHWLSIMYDIYIISQRSHESSNLGLRGWLHWVLGLDLDTIAGVITGPSGRAAEGTDMDKAGIIKSLGCVAHFDDYPLHIEACPVGILFPSEMPESQSSKNLYPTVHNWGEVREFLTTPGFTLHGRDGRSILSPAEVNINTPPMDVPILN